ncbi:uncharacterized protein PRCAT00003447001 [Priceomyces carsonii]|uniref:uncharacterized protein n=1 Tax=Priceomyces carsonii TaxID=28549 RepID=UPI002ED8FE42|nr:unnamed protein product [Priceomyces carsonii]
MLIVNELRLTFGSFFLFGLLNNILYVIILSAAIDLVGSSMPKAIVLLADVTPSLAVKLTAPFFVHFIPYYVRLWLLVVMSGLGMLVISLSSQTSIGLKVFGIALASLSSGLGELTFLQLTHFYKREYSVGGFSSGTGGAGLFGSFLFMLFTNVFGLNVRGVLLMSSVLPLGFLATFYILLPLPGITEEVIEYESLQSEEIQQSSIVLDNPKLSMAFIKQHIRNTVTNIRPLIKPYMLPLCSVYICEYVINQGVSPTLLFDLKGLPRWLFSSYRDIYVVYGFLYQLGVFISRSSINFGIRLRNLYWLSILQFINLVLTLCQSIYDLPFPNIWLLMILIFYEGLLGGFLYINTFISVSEDVPISKREFSMGCVSISDSLGVVLAGCFNFWLEIRLCQLQVRRGRDWCRNGGGLT